MIKKVIQIHLKNQPFYGYLGMLSASENLHFSMVHLKLKQKAHHLLNQYIEKEYFKVFVLLFLWHAQEGILVSKIIFDTKVILYDPFFVVE